MKQIIKFIQKELEDYDKNIWNEKKVKNKQYIEHFNEKKKITIECRQKKLFILHVPFGDIHLGHTGTDLEKAEYHAKLIGSKPYIFGYNIGDSIDNFIKTSIISAVINSDTTPKQQIKLMQQYLEFFNGNLILMIGGNHDRWTKKVSGLDWLAPFCDKNNLVYSPDEFNIIFTQNKIEYKFKFRHKYRFSSYMNPTHKSKQMLRNSEYIFDVGCVAHDHEVAMEMSYMFGAPRLHIRCGSYKVADPFANEIGYNNAKADLPCFITNPFKKEIMPFFNIEQAVKVVKFLNEGK
jgi:hypothetical protein